MRLKYLLAIVFSALPLFASAQKLQNENLSFDIPKDFILGADLSRSGLGFLEYIPKNETVDNWSKMLTIQVLNGLPARGVTGDRFQNWFGERMKQTCPGAQTSPIETGTVNSYNFQQSQVYCPLSPMTQKAEFFVIKTIDGADSLYSIQYSFTSAPNDAKINEAIEYLRTVKVCDTRIAGRECSIGR